jgi:hypothetical protein
VSPLLATAQLSEALGDASRLALAWIPWIALVGLPLRDDPARSWPLALGLALPALALAGWVDLAQGLGSARLEATFLGGLFCVVLLGEARARAAAAGVGAYGPLWLLLVPLLPALAAALAWGTGGRLPPEGPVALLGRISPLAATWHDVQPAEGQLLREAWDSALFCPSTLACLALWLVVVGLARRPGGRP